MKQTKHTLLLLALILLFSSNILSQEVTVADNSISVFNQYLIHISPYKSASLEKILEKTAQFFIGTPYVEHTLDKGDTEQLVINLEALDCVTFVENVLALSLSTHHNELSFDSFKKYLQQIRYRNGEISDYSSRLHYTTDWLYENEKNKVLSNISQELSGKIEDKPINFMSSHRNAYKQLATNDAMLHKVEQTEKAINNRGGFYYIPKGAIYSNAKDIPHMAVIGFVTQIKGLDTTHVGFAYQSDDELTFIHASSKEGKVIIDSSTLNNYCFSQKQCIGIIVAKVLPQY